MIWAILFFIVFIVVAVATYFGFSSIKKSNEFEIKMKNLLASRISEQKLASGFSVSHEYLAYSSHTEDTFISLSTRELMSRRGGSLYLASFDAIDSVNIKTKKYENIISWFIMELTFKDCKKSRIIIHDIDDLIYWHNIFKGIT
jgi:hypothetical protein